tara:strand:- start:7228 stop:7470 length:243 start_codon:yes stop_codon:yes gene_type:complete
MAYKTCENCGSRIFNLGCVNCNEIHYINEQEMYTQFEIEETLRNEEAVRREEERSTCECGRQQRCGVRSGLCPITGIWHT